MASCRRYRGYTDGTVCRTEADIDVRARQRRPRQVIGRERRARQRPDENAGDTLVERRFYKGHPGAVANGGQPVVRPRRCHPDMNQ